MASRICASFLLLVLKASASVIECDYLNSAYDFSNKWTIFGGKAWITSDGSAWYASMDGTSNMYIERSFSTIGHQDLSVSFEYTGNRVCQLSVFYACGSSSSMIRISDYPILGLGQEYLWQSINHPLSASSLCEDSSITMRFQQRSGQCLIDSVCINSPTNNPTSDPTTNPTNVPSYQPSQNPSSHSSYYPTSDPTSYPSHSPSSKLTSRLYLSVYVHIDRSIVCLLHIQARLSPL